MGYKLSFNQVPLARFNTGEKRILCFSVFLELMNRDDQTGLNNVVEKE